MCSHCGEAKGGSRASDPRWLAQPSVKMQAKNSEPAVQDAEVSVSISHVEVQSTGWLANAESVVMCRSSSNPTPRQVACMAAALPADIKTGRQSHYWTGLPQKLELEH
jgi:hypothetical protein